MSAWCLGTYARFPYAKCNLPQLTRVALTSRAKLRPTFEAESFETYEPSVCVHRISMKSIQ